MLPSWVVPAEFAQPAKSVLVVPLPGHGVSAGAMILIRGGDRPTFSDSEEVFVRIFAARAGAALSAARMYTEQSRITNVLLRELLPPTLHQVHGIEFAGRYHAAQHTDRVGGDFYEVYPATDPGGETFAVLGDVCGSGLEAAMIAGKIRGMLRALLPLTDDHRRVLELLNAALLSDEHTRFVTLVLASVRRVGPAVRLRVTRAGHPPPLVLNRDGQVTEPATDGSLIGVLPVIEADTAAVELGPGESCLLYTDGVIDSRGGPLGDVVFGEPRLRAALGECSGLPAEAVAERIMMLASEWTGRRLRRDDMAVLAITAPRGSHLSAVGGHTRGRFTA